MAKINWTGEAESWLRELYDYIAADDLRAAVRTVSGIYEKAQLLKQYPEIFTSMNLKALAPSGFCFTATIA